MGQEAPAGDLPELWWEPGTGVIERFRDAWRMSETGEVAYAPSQHAVRLVAAPADDTGVQGWGDAESADFIERARAATAVGSFTAQFDHVYDPSGDLVCESVDHSTAVRIAAALSAVPADDTAAPVPYDDPEKET